MWIVEGLGNRRVFRIGSACGCGSGRRVFPAIAATTTTTPEQLPLHLLARDG